MYLSRLILNPRTRQVQRELAEPYQMHRSIMQAFPNGLQQNEERVLWRVDDHPRLGPVLLVQSWGMPDWTSLADGYLRPLNQPNPAIKPFEPALSAGQPLRFRLRANPTAKRRSEASGERKRMALYKDAEQLAWLQRKAAAAGFEIISINIANEGNNAGRKPNNGSNHVLTLLAVRFDGILHVTDPAALHTAIQTGIGSGKGLGFGLLSLAPINSGSGL
ncbi:MAG: type I-E CRISPR-associated protein Cas6/Cse3/CasE [Anaerolineae bacterium]